MSESLFSPQWYRVASLKPQLRGHAQIHRHQYRGQIWYVLQDLSSTRMHRFTPVAYRVIGLMDGRRNVQEIWEKATEGLGDDAPTQDEMIQLLGQLHATDVLQCDVPPDTAELLQRHEKQERRQWQSRLMSPMAWRFPLFDPEKILQAGIPFVRPLMSWWGALLWLAVVFPAVVLAGVHWSELTQNIVDRILAPQNLALIWLLFPVLKILHEFGHGFAVKAFGGEVHEMGVMILVLTPLPYVDASAASAFRSKWQRIGVGAAGMVVEVFLASLALLVWINAEPGLVRTLAYNAVLIAGVSTLLFNANPLLRFDGYYILGDVLEIPNLGTRSTSYLGYLVEHYLFGRREAEPPSTLAGERAWLVNYAILSFLYRIFVISAIILFIAGKFFIVGVLLATAAVILWAIVPAVKGAKFLLTSPRLRQVRGRALGVSALGLALLLALTCVVPAPLRTRAEGVVWIPDESLVRVGTEGFVARVVAKPGSRVMIGDVLVECEELVLSTEVKVLQARREELRARYMQQRIEDRVRAQIAKEQLQYVEKRLARARQREADLTIHSNTEGTFVLTRAADLPGRFVRKGQLLGYVVDLETITVRAAVSQDDIDLIRQRSHGADVRLAERIDQPIEASIKRVLPAATEELPSMALGSQGGGEIAVDPRDTGGALAMQKYFQVELELPLLANVINVGGRVHVRFDHGWEPLAVQGYRRLRQLFLSRFNV